MSKVFEELNERIGELLREMDERDDEELSLPKSTP